MPSEDSEIVLGTGRLLVLFLGLVALCGVFFGLGFSVGRNSASSAAASAGPPSPGETTSTPKSSAGTPAAAQPSPEDLTFYKTVEQKDPEPELEPPQPAKPPRANSPFPGSKHVAAGIMVQVAAVSKQEDADALAAALRRKQYRVQTTSLPSDSLIRVQIGPFTDLKSAEAMRARLRADGYNPIVKK